MMILGILMKRKFCFRDYDCFPDELDELMQFAESVEKKDLLHKRLLEYKLLERKSEASKGFESKTEFLFDSNIKVSIFGDCIEEAQRIDELVRRTNQLNFTKNRESTEQLIYSFGNPNLKKGFVCVSDKYGDYGVVGFFCFEPGNRKLKHFLFSCRIMGMGISECIYNYLGKPEIDVAEPVAADLFKEMQTPWIELFEENESVISDFGERPLSDFSILLKGPCDMGAIQNYISIGNIATEFNYVNRSGYICAGYNHSVNIFESTNMEKEEISRMIDDIPFVSSEDFETSIFEEKYQVICYSLLQDYHAGLYRRKGTDFLISFGMADFPITDPVN